jgi:recombinational DNA repair protein (RecF pathway)
MARARSAGFITSRLSSYLQPLRRVQARLIEKNGIQVVDALPVGDSMGRSAENIGLCQIVRSLTSEHHADEKLWNELIAPKPSPLRILMVLGFDPRHATCHMCETNNPEYFSSRDAHYYCASCAKSFSSIEGLYRLGRVAV